MPGNVNEQSWNKAKDIFKKSYGHEPKSSSDFAILQTIYKKIEHIESHREMFNDKTYREDFIADLKNFLWKNLNNPILTFMIVHYIAKMLGKNNTKGIKEKFKMFGDDGELTPINNLSDMNLTLTSLKLPRMTIKQWKELNLLNPGEKKYIYNQYYVIKEKFIHDGGWDLAISMTGEPLKKVGNVRFYRTDWEADATHEVWSDSGKTVQVATNAIRPWNEEDPTDICNDRLCAIDKVWFTTVKSGYELKTPYGEIRGDLHECPICHAKYLDGITDRELTNKLSKENIGDTHMAKKEKINYDKYIKDYETLSKTDFLNKHKNLTAKDWEDLNFKYRYLLNRGEESLKQRVNNLKEAQIQHLDTTGRKGFVVANEFDIENLEYSHDETTATFILVNNQDEYKRKIEHPLFVLTCNIQGQNGIINVKFKNQIIQKNVYTHNNKQLNLTVKDSENNQFQIHSIQSSKGLLTFEVLFDKGVVDTIQSSLKQRINILKEGFYSDGNKEIYEMIKVEETQMCNQIIKIMNKHHYPEIDTFLNDFGGVSTFSDKTNIVNVGRVIHIFSTANIEDFKPSFDEWKEIHGKQMYDEILEQYNNFKNNLKNIVTAIFEFKNIKYQSTHIPVVIVYSFTMPSKESIRQNKLKESHNDISRQAKVQIYKLFKMGESTLSIAKKLDLDVEVVTDILYDMEAEREESFKESTSSLKQKLLKYFGVDEDEDFDSTSSLVKALITNKPKDVIETAEIIQDETGWNERDSKDTARDVWKIISKSKESIKQRLVNLKEVFDDKSYTYDVEIEFASSYVLKTQSMIHNIERTTMNFDDLLSVVGYLISDNKGKIVANNSTTSKRLVEDKNVMELLRIINKMIFKNIPTTTENIKKKFPNFDKYKQKAINMGYIKYLPQKNQWELSKTLYLSIKDLEKIFKN